MSATLSPALALLLAAFPPQPGGAVPDARPEPLPREERTGPDDWLEKFPGPQDGFMLRLQSLCTGERYAGRMVSGDPRDADMRGEPLTMGPADCTLDDGRLTAIAIPFAVGDDASRTWRLSRTGVGIKLRHRHVLPDGTEDPVSGYGGVAMSSGEGGGGTFTRQAFPADAETRALFLREGLDASVANVWSVEIVPGDGFAYALDRPGGDGGPRAFRAAFDLARPLPREADQAARADE